MREKRIAALRAQLADAKAKEAVPATATTTTTTTATQSMASSTTTNDGSIASIEAELATAIAGQDFQRAIALRDSLRRAKEIASSSSSSSSSSPSSSSSSLSSSSSATTTSIAGSTAAIDEATLRNQLADAVAAGDYARAIQLVRCVYINLNLCVSVCCCVMERMFTRRSARR